MRALVLQALVAAPALGGPDVGIEGFYTTQDVDLPQQCHPAPQLPADLAGTFLLGGPSIFDFKGYKFNQVNDGYGRFYKFTLEGAQVCLAAKTMRTGFWNESTRLGRVAPSLLLQETHPPRPKCMGTESGICDMLGPNDNCFVNSMQNGQQVSMVTDSVVTLDIDVASLTVLGKHKYKNVDGFIAKGRMAALSSAHPVRVQGGHVEILLELPISNKSQASYVDFVKVLDADGGHSRQLLARIEADRPWYDHSFGVTDKYVILPLTMAMSVPSPTDKRMDMIDRFLGDVFQGIAVVRLGAGPELQEPIIFQTKPFYHLHTASSYETETGSIVVDLVTYQYNMFRNASGARLDMVLNKTRRDQDANRASLERFELFVTGPKAGTVARRVLTSPKRSVDFPKINEKYATKRYCYIYGSEWWHDEDSWGSMAVLKANTCGPKTTYSYWYRENWYPSEVNFVARDNATGEDDGYLVFAALQGETNTSQLVVVNATTMQEVSATPLDYRVTFTAHGQFFKRGGPIPRAISHTVIV